MRELPGPVLRALEEPAGRGQAGGGLRFDPAGRGQYRDARDRVGGITDARATVWRWRPAFQADFRARLGWCVRPAKGANHPPAPVLNGDTSGGVVQVRARAGEVV